MSSSLVAFAAIIDFSFTTDASTTTLSLSARSLSSSVAKRILDKRRHRCRLLADRRGQDHRIAFGLGSTDEQDLTVAFTDNDLELDQIVQEACARLEAHLPLSLEAQQVIVAQENLNGIWSNVAELRLQPSRLIGSGS